MTMDNPETLVQHNARQLAADIFWFGVLAGSAMGFVPVYAARIGASGFQLALLSAGPAVVNLLGSLPSARWLETQPLIRATVWSSIIHRLGYVALLFLPLLFPAAAQTWVLPALIVLMAVPGVILAIAFNAMFADVIPPAARSQVVGRRNALMAFSVMATALVSGWVLENVAFPLNYQIVFGLGAVGAALSSYYLSRVRPLATPPPRINQPLDDGARPGFFRFADTLRSAPGLRFLLRAAGRPLLRLDLLQGTFGRLMLAYLLFYTFQYTPIALFPLVWVQELGLPDWVISVGSAAFNLAMLLASVSLAKLTARIGPKPLLTLSAVLYALYPFLHSQARGAAFGAEVFLIASVIGGGVWGLANGGLTTRLMERTPDTERPTFMALHNVVLNFGILGGSFLGPLLAGWLGLQEALLLSAFLRVAAGVALWWWS